MFKFISAYFLSSKTRNGLSSSTAQADRNSLPQTPEPELLLKNLKPSSEVEASEQRLSLAVKAGRMGIWEYNTETHEVYWDDNMFNLLGIQPCSSDEIGKFWKQTLAPEDLELMISKFHELTKTGKSFEQQYPVKIGNRTVYIHSMGSAVVEPNGKIVRAIGVNRDVTQEVESQMALETKRVRLMGAAKMASLGEMASNIAHEINNPLAIILAKVDLLRSLIEKDNDELSVQENLQKIESTALRISKIIQGLRGFSRDASREPFILTPLLGIIHQTLDICGLKFSLANIELSLDVNENIQLECRAAELAQVFINLLNNSYYAVANQPKRKISIKAESYAEHVEIYFSDTGAPIPPAVKRKILEPFFTTKPAGLGTGLGLTISRILVENHRGQLELLQEVAQTTFLIRLPKLQLQNESASEISPSVP